MRSSSESADSAEVRLQVLEGDSLLGIAHPLRCRYTFCARQVLVEGLKELAVQSDEQDTSSPAGAEQGPSRGGQQARIEALRALARERKQEQSAARAEAHATERPRLRLAPRSSYPRRRAWLAIGVAVVAILALGGGILLRFGPRGTASTPTITPTEGPIQSQLTLNLAKLKLNCPAHIAWSPDATRIAVAIALQGCFGYPGAALPEKVAIFDARSGALLQTLAPQTALSRLGVAARAGEFVWSRDGSQLLFDVNSVNPDGDTAPALLILPLHGGQPRYLHATLVNSTTPSVMWDLQTGAGVAQVNTLQPAISYWWDSGEVVVNQPAPGNVSATAFAGSPVLSSSSTTLSFYQSGAILELLSGVDAQGSTTGLLPPPAAAFVFTGPVASPDGQYLAMPLRLVARLPQIPGIPSSQLSPRSCDSPIATACSGPAVPFADAALEAVARAADVGTPVPLGGGRTALQYTQTPTLLAWRPDGNILAAVPPAPQPSQQPQTPLPAGASAAPLQVELFDTDTGAVFTALPTGASTDMSVTPVLSTVAWSPTGQQLAFCDYFSDRLIIWGANRLPA